MSGSSSTNAVSPAGSSPNDLGSDSGSEVSQFSQAGNELIANLVQNVSPEGNSRSQSPDPTTASRQQRLIPTDDRDNEDALSSVSERTAVPSSSTDDVGRRVQARAREIEEELSRFCVDAGNRIPVTARHFIMAKVFEMVQLYSDLRADAAADRGAIRALKDQLVESRRETAALHRRAILAETRTGLLHPEAVVDHAAHAAPASTQPGAASALPGPFLPGAPGQPVPRTYAAALLSGAAPTASTVRPGLDGSVPALPPALHEHVAFAMVTLRARSVHVFTDGSYANRAAGAAYVAFGVRSSVIHVGRFRLKRATSAYAAEVLGLVEALKHVLAARYTLPVAIYTDCLSLLQANHLAA
ncbi:hypothetical protein MTO96_046102 [Rhipicephalus appendiculatus]